MNSPEERIRARIERDGPIPFAEFMEEALYGEAGYYATDTLSIGPQGDFITGSALSPLFGASTARLLGRLAEQLGEADLLEAGYGDGSHLAALLEARGADRASRVWAWDRVTRPAPAGVTTIGDLDQLRRPVRGLVFSYELFDALPVHRLRRTTDGWQEIRVGLASGEGSAGSEYGWVPTEVDLPEVASMLTGYTELTEPGQIVDLSLDWGPLYRRLADALDTGLLVTCDYGFERGRLLDGRVRANGTLACYRRQTVHRNPFVDIGGQDITAHVDLTTLIEAGEAAGLETVALVSQAEWLGANGVFDGLAEAVPAVRLEAARLLDPGAMGSAIRVLVQSRGTDHEGLFDLPLGNR